MRDGIRRRLAGDDGMTLVEILVAVMVLTMGLFALLGSFIASAHSLQEQERRSVATRVATETLEQLRSAGFEELDAPSTTEVTVERAGIEFTLRTDIDWLDALEGPPGDAEDVKFATVTASWTVRGNAREVAFSTAVSALEGSGFGAAGPGPAIVTVSASPDPVLVDEDGAATQDITLRATLEGFDGLPTVTAQWFNHASGATETEILPAVDFETEWAATDVPASRFHRPDDSDELNIVFEVTSVDGTLTRTYELRMTDEIVDGPGIISTTISQNPITVRAPHSEQGCNHPNQNCRNTDDIMFRATVTGLDTDNVDSVKVRYLRRDGSFGELALIQNELDSSVWRRELTANSERFAVGASKAFTFIATSVTDGVTTSVTVQHWVQEEV